MVRTEAETGALGRWADLNIGNTVLPPRAEGMHGSPSSNLTGTSLAHTSVPRCAEAPASPRHELSNIPKRGATLALTAQQETSSLGRYYQSAILSIWLINA